MNDAAEELNVDQFVVCWCEEGLECVVPVTEIEKEIAWSILTNKGAPGNDNINKILNMLILRARYNQQRHYEIYAVNAVFGITKEDITTMFEQSPQSAADLIRERGVKIYSDRAVVKNRIKIT